MDRYEMKKQYEKLQEKSSSAQTQMERTQRLLNRIKSESTRKSSEMDKLQHEFSLLGDRLRVLENKAMEVEKLEISVDTLKKALENTQQEVRERERDVRRLERILEQTDKELKVSEQKVQDLEKTNLDLKLQVREEIIKRTQLEMKIENTTRLKEEMEERKKEIEDMKNHVEESHLIAQHARKCLREEKQKCQRLESDQGNLSAMREELELVSSENITLKRLLAAKDTVIRHRSQLVDNLKNTLKDHIPPKDFKIAMKKLNDNLEPNPFNVIYQRSPQDRKLGSSTSSHPTDNLKSNVYRPSTVNESTSGSSQSPCGQTQFLQTLLNGEHSQDNQSHISSMKHPKTAIVRPRMYADSFTDFRSTSPTQSDVTSITSSHYNTWSHSHNGRSDDSDDKPIRRSSSFRQSSYTGSRSSMTSSSVEQLHAWNKGGSMKDNGQGQIKGWNMPPQAAKVTHSDSKLLPHIKLGDRVVVDVSKHKGAGRDLQTGLVKYLGHLDNGQDSNRVYVGVKLDGPDGDTDGLFRGKRYFRVSPSHGKFVRINKVLSLFDKNTGSYHRMEDILSKTGQRSSQNIIQSIH